MSADCNTFAKKFQSDCEALQKHAQKFTSQYKRIRAVKEFVQKEENKSKLLRIDWSENVDLYQTRQSQSCSVYLSIINFIARVSPSPTRLIVAILAVMDALLQNLHILLSNYLTRYEKKSRIPG